MCRRYVISTTPEAIESKFGLSLLGKSLLGGTTKQPLPDFNNYNISPGQFAPVITNEKPHEVQLFKFGLTPFWAKSEMNLCNARAEGDYNQEDNPTFRGAAGIILKKAFRKPIRSQRCIVIASAFIEGPSALGLNKPYLIYLRNHQNPFAIAGIWDTWLNPQTGEIINSFCIITISANNLMQKISQHRMPVILTRNEEKKWINPNTGLSTITSMLKHYDSKLMNAYPISQRINNLTENDKQLIQPVGSRVLLEEENHVQQSSTYQGYYRSKKHQSPDDSRPSWGEISALGRATES